MLKKIKLKNQDINYNLKISKRARYLRLVINRGGELVVIKPRFLSDLAVEKFIKKKTDWIINKINYFLKALISQPKISSSNELYEQNKIQALELVKNKINYFNGFYKFKYNQVKVKNHKLNSNRNYCLN